MVKIISKDEARALLQQRSRDPRPVYQSDLEDATILLIQQNSERNPERKGRRQEMWQKFTMAAMIEKGEIDDDSSNY